MNSGPPIATQATSVVASSSEALAASWAESLGEGGWGVRATGSSRLSFTLIDLNGEGGRRNGMASLALCRPSFRGTVLPGEAVHLSERTQEIEYAQEIAALIEKLGEHWETPPAQIDVERALPAHNGFGSKTTTLLALGRAYATLVGRRCETAELAQVAGRAGTSGASVNLIERGGFLVDGGHANPEDFAEDPQRYLVPSRFAGSARKPPVLVNLPFPPWPILILVGEGTELSGQAELDWFRETLPIPARAAQHTAHHILMHLAPAIAEADYRAFCTALNTLTYEHHYKQLQIEVQSEEIQRMFREAREERSIDAICISVTGPMCYAFSRRPREAERWALSLRERGMVREYFWSGAQNHPLVLEGVPA